MGNDHLSRTRWTRLRSERQRKRRRKLEANSTDGERRVAAELESLESSPAKSPQNPARFRTLVLRATTSLRATKPPGVRKALKMYSAANDTTVVRAVGDCSQRSLRKGRSKSCNLTHVSAVADLSQIVADQAIFGRFSHIFPQSNYLILFVFITLRKNVSYRGASR
jgi:hypothetical protein